MFDDTLIEIASNNIDVFSIKRSGNEKDALLEELVNLSMKEMNEILRKSLINKLVGFSFEQIFNKNLILFNNF